MENQLQTYIFIIRLTCSRGILTEGLMSHKLLCICCYVGSDEDSDEDSDDESDWDEDDEESEEEGGYDLDICPPGCDQVRLVVCNGFLYFFYSIKIRRQMLCNLYGLFQNIYDNTCQLREKKLDIEEALQEEKKNNDGLKKDIESNNKKLKVVDSALKAAQNDLEAFQVFIAVFCCIGKGVRNLR